MTACAGDATPAGSTAPRPLRSDAARNRQRILHAAAEVFTERGLDATLDDVARRAGVGVGTVYRRFPDKESLVETLFTGRIDEMVAAARKACASPDPWDGLVAYLEYAAAALAGDAGLRQMVMFATYGGDRVAYAREQLRPVIDELVTRAQEAGDLREDFRPTDVPLIAYMLASAAEYAGAVEPDLWRRYLAMIIDSLRPAREGTAALPVAALSLEDFARATGTRGGRPSARN
ncbi:MAG: TetR/AcrR family transcriptional regulator, partial [Trebonia sp.]